MDERGYRLAVVEDRQTGEQVRVYRRLGRWRFYRDDTQVKDRALSATARRVLA